MVRRETVSPDPGVQPRTFDIEDAYRERWRKDPGAKKKESSRER